MPATELKVTVDLNPEKLHAASSFPATHTRLAHEPENTPILVSNPTAKHVVTVTVPPKPFVVNHCPPDVLSVVPHVATAWAVRPTVDPETV